MFYEAFGQLVKSHRKAKNLSQQQLSEMIGISRGTVINIELGKFAVQFHTALDVAAALGISLHKIEEVRSRCKLEEELSAYPEDIRNLVEGFIHPCAPVV